LFIFILICSVNQWIVDECSSNISKIHEFIPQIKRGIEKKRPSHVLSSERSQELEGLSIRWDPYEQHVSNSYIEPPLI